MGEAIITPEIKAVFFDAVGTLIEPEPSAVDVYHSVGVEHGVNVSPETIAQRFRVAFELEERADAALGWKVSEARERSRWSNIVHCVFDQHERSNAILASLWFHFARPEAWQVLDQSDVPGNLAHHGLAVGIASNFDRRLNSVLRGFPTLDSISRRVISSKLGWRKPSYKFFCAVVAAAGCEPDQIVFVGDRRDVDYEPALTMGMRAVLLDPFAKSNDTVRRISSLYELINPNPV